MVLMHIVQLMVHGAHCALLVLLNQLNLISQLIVIGSSEERAPSSTTGLIVCDSVSRSVCIACSHRSSVTSD
jgi:hypothetical protein